MRGSEQPSCGVVPRAPSDYRPQHACGRCLTRWPPTAPNGRPPTARAPGVISTSSQPQPHLNFSNGLSLISAVVPADLPFCRLFTRLRLLSCLRRACACARLSNPRSTSDSPRATFDSPLATLHSLLSQRHSYRYPPSLPPCQGGRQCRAMFAAAVSKVRSACRACQERGRHDVAERALRSVEAGEQVAGADEHGLLREIGALSTLQNAMHDFGDSINASANVFGSALERMEAVVSWAHGMVFSAGRATHSDAQLAMLDQRLSTAGLRRVNAHSTTGLAWTHTTCAMHHTTRITIPHPP